MTVPGEETDDAELGSQLRSLREEFPADDFQASLHRRLVAAGPPVAGSPWERLRDSFRRVPVLWPALGVLVGVLTFVGLGPLVGSSRAPVGTEVPVTKVAVIKLDFTADVAVQEANFQVSLPDGLAFWADGEELPVRSFEWTQPLNAGNNVIPIAVKGQKPGRYRVLATAVVGGQRIEHDVYLEVTGA